MPRTLRALIVLLLATAPAAAQDRPAYDLTPGTQRYFHLCDGLAVACIPEAFGFGIETVLAPITLNGQAYATVAWISETSEGNGVLVRTRDTTYYRLDGPRLMQYTERGDSLIQDFGFTEGDALAPFFDQPGNHFDPPNFVVHDTAATFLDGERYRIVWADDPNEFAGTALPDVQLFLDSVLVDHLPYWPDRMIQNWLLPAREVHDGDFKYYLNRPFYYVESMGIVMTPYTHRGMPMVAYVAADGTIYGDPFFELPTAITPPDTPPMDFSLQPSYPNPFREAAALAFELARPAQVRLAVYDALGQRVALLVDAVLPAGRHGARFAAEGRPGGVYFARLDVGGQRQVQKMVLRP